MGEVDESNTGSLPAEPEAYPWRLVEVSSGTDESTDVVFIEGSDSSLVAFVRQWGIDLF